MKLSAAQDVLQIVLMNLFPRCSIQIPPIPARTDRRDLRDAMVHQHDQARQRRSPRHPLHPDRVGDHLRHHRHLRPLVVHIRLRAGQRRDDPEGGGVGAGGDEEFLPYDHHQPGGSQEAICAVVWKWGSLCNHAFKLVARMQGLVISNDFSGNSEPNSLVRR